MGFLMPLFYRIFGGAAIRNLAIRIGKLAFFPRSGGYSGYSRNIVGDSPTRAVKAEEKVDALR